MVLPDDFKLNLQTQINTLYIADRPGWVLSSTKYIVTPLILLHSPPLCVRQLKRADLSEHHMTKYGNSDYD